LREASSNKHKGIHHDLLSSQSHAVNRSCRSLRIHHSWCQRGSGHRNSAKRCGGMMRRDTKFITPIRERKIKMTKLMLNRANKKIVGVCSGLADWSGLDVTVIRILFVLATIFGFGSALLIYVVLALVLD
jgi:phage shock protein C